MTPDREREAVEKAARRIRAFERWQGRGGGYGFIGPTALEVLEAATGGFCDRTVRLARRALARAGGRVAGPREVEHVPEDRGLEAWGAGADGSYRRI